MIVQPSRPGPPNGIMRAMLDRIARDGPMTLDSLCAAFPAKPPGGRWRHARRSNLRLAARFGWVWFDGSRWHLTDEGYAILQEEAA